MAAFLSFLNLSSCETELTTDSNIVSICPPDCSDSLIIVTDLVIVLLPISLANV